MEAVDELSEQDLDLDFEIVTHSWNSLSVPGKYLVTIQNNSGQALLAKSITLTAPDNQTNQIDLPPLLPYQSISVPVSLKSNNWLESDQVSVQLGIDETTYQAVLTRGPKTIYYLFGWPGLTLALTVIVVTLGAGSLLVFRR